MYSTRIERVKEQFTQEWIGFRLPEAKVPDAHRRRGEHGIWQPLFWEHTITDESDYGHHI